MEEHTMDQRQPDWLKALTGEKPPEPPRPIQVQGPPDDGRPAFDRPWGRDWKSLTPLEIERLQHWEG
jgi:hypothetical protein